MSRDIHPGQLLDNRFQITDLIERSRFGAIFKARDIKTGRTVVVKAPDDKFIALAGRFAREAAILAKLDHPGVPKVVSIAAKSCAYVVMEYIDGESLWNILRRRGRLPVADALALGSRLCEILDYVHRHEVVHLDIKPGNIMISDDGQLHLIDFGIAKGPAATKGLRWFSSRSGTPEYMAPEQIRGDHVDNRTDLYGLGAVLYQVVTGSPPFHGNTDDEIFDARLNGKPRLPRELNGGITEQVEEILLHAMAPNPADRYASAAAMKAELDYPENVSVTRQYEDPPKPSTWPKRLRTAGLILAAACAPFILFYIFLLMFKRRAMLPRKP